MGQGARMAAGSAAGLGSYPVAYDVPVLPERRSRAAVRFYAVWSAVALLAVGSLASLIIALMPLKSVVPVFAVRNADGVYGTTVTPEVVSGDNAYVTQLVKNYISLRFSILSDRAEMARIWGKSGELASIDPSFALFLKETGDAIMSDINAGITQTPIVIRTEEIVPGTAYIVDFDLVRRDRAGKTIDRMAWRGHAEVEFDQQRAGTMTNPLGFKMVAFSQEPRR